MTAARPLASVFMFGPDLSARGGIASVASVLVHEPSLERFGVRYVATWVHGTRIRRASVFLSALLVAARLKPGSVAHVHMSARGSFLRKALVTRLAARRGAHVIVHLHSGEFHKFAAGSGPYLKRAITRVFETADAVLVLSAVWKERVAAFSGRGDSIVIPNPVNVPAQRAAMVGPPKVVFLGRLGDQKGTPELFEAIMRLQRRGLTDVDWVLAGDGDVARFRQLAAGLPVPERVKLTGWLSREGVQQELSSAWVFCLPSHDEGKPVALLEAMASGLASVATPVGGIPDLLEDGVTGLLVGVGDIAGLCDALERLLDSREECLSLGRRARGVVSDAYRPDIVGAALAALYDRLLSGGGPADARAESATPGGAA